MDFQLLAGGPSFTCPHIWEHGILPGNSPGHLEMEREGLSFASHTAFRIDHCEPLELFRLVSYLNL